MSSVRLVFLCCALAWALPAWAAVEYTLVDLGAQRQVNAISEANEIVGDSEASGTQVPALLRPTFAELPPLPGQAALGTAEDVQHGHVTGFVGSHAFLYSAQGYADLDAADPDAFSTGTGINASSTVAGFANHDITTRPVVYIAGQRLDLGTLGGRNGSAFSINADGDIAGQSQLATGTIHATLWPVEGGVIDLDLGNPRQSMAFALNSQGQVIGDASTATGFHLTVWDIDGTIRDAGTLPGHVRSHGAAINDQGVSVGSSTPAGGGVPPSTAVRVQDGIMVDLNTLVTAPGWTLEAATGINNAGRIVGNGRLNGVPHAWLLLPVESPSARRKAPKPRRTHAEVQRLLHILRAAHHR